MSINHVVMYGVKLPFLKFRDDDFEGEVYDFHNPYMGIDNIDPDRIYILNDNLCGDYTVVGFIIEFTSYDECFEGFVDITETGDVERIYEFLWKRGDIVPEEIPDAELLIFSHIS